MHTGLPPTRARPRGVGPALGPASGRTFRAAVALLALSHVGCTSLLGLGVDSDFVEGSRIARATTRSPYTDTGIDVGYDIRRSSRDVYLGPELGLAAAVDRAPTPLFHALLSGGYAYVPRPFEGRWGYDVGAEVGGGTRPRAAGTQSALLVGARASLLLRLTAEREVWEEDKATTSSVYFFAGPQGMGVLGCTPTFEPGAVFGVRAAWYSTEAP